MNFKQYIPKRPDYNPKNSAQDLTLWKFEGLVQLEQRKKPMPKNEFQTLVEKTQALIFILQNQEISYINPVAQALLGYPPRSGAWAKFYHQLNPQGWQPDQLPLDHTQELNIVNQDGQEYWLNCDFTTIDFQGQPAIMITAFDVTKYKQAFTAEQEQSKNQARFVSMVSHEFRTSLNIISFSTSLLKRYLQQWTEEKQLKYLDRLQTAVEQLSHLMDEVLIIGRAEAGKLKFDPQPLDLTRFCQQLLAEINLAQSQQPNINFVNLLAHQTILLDKNLLKLVLINLLSNAIKYSPPASKIELIVSCTQDHPQKMPLFKPLLAQGDDCLILQVKDQGMGIPWEEQVKIFEPFHRSGNVGDLPGNGLGLAIALKLVKLQGGEIILQSQLKQGSTFTVLLPLKLPHV